MAPPGRRRTLSFPLMIALVLLLFVPFITAQSAVLGIDLGTEYIKAALVKPGIPLDIVLTKDSKRKETSAIAFKASGPIDLERKQYPERLYGGDALALAPRIPGDVYPNLKHVLAGSTTPFGNAAVKAYKERYPALVVTDGAPEGTLGFRSMVLGSEVEAFSVEELLAMELKGIRQNAQAMAGKGSIIRDAVITVPAFYTAEERKAVTTAAELAGLKVIGLISDGLAVGINYATLRTFSDPDKGGKAEQHLVYDMGAGSTTATVLRFQAKTVKDVGKFNKTIQEVTVLGVGWDRRLGGDTLNDFIVNDMVEQFVQSKAAQSIQVDSGKLKQHGRAMAKLTREAERARQVLSANTETSAFFEGLYEDIDFRYKLSRGSFETMASSFVERVGDPITAALNKAGLSLEDIDSIILHGGAVRTPFVQSSLETLVSDPAKLKTNVNADEAAVFGAAFKAAGLSSSFRVKEIKARDVASYSATVHWVSNGKEKKQTIFQPTSSMDTVKQMPIKMLDDFALSITQNIPSLETDETLSRPITTVQIANLTANVQELVDKYACARNNISTIISFHLDPNTGLPAVVRGTTTCESEVSEKSGGGIMDDVKGLFGFGSKKDQKPLNAEDDGDVESELLPDLPDSSTSSSSTTTSATTTSSASASASKSSKVDSGKKTHTMNIKITFPSADGTGLDASATSAIKARLAAFDASDRARVKRSETFNTLEALTYRVRDLLTDSPFQAASSDSQRSAIESLLSTTSDWLSAEGAEATYDAIKEKLGALQGLVDPIKNRITESAKRPASIQALQEALNSTSAIMALIREQVDRASSSASDGIKDMTKAMADAMAGESSSTTSPSSSTTTAPSSNDNLDDFPNSESSSTTSSASSTTTKTPSPFSLASSFTEADYTSLSTLYDSVTSWFSESQLAQDALSAYDDPSLTTADLERKAKQLSDATNDMLRKMMRRDGGSSRSSKKASKATKIRTPTPKVSVVTEGGPASSATSSTGPPDPEPVAPVEDTTGEAGKEPTVPAPEVADKVLDEEDGAVPIPPVESTTEPQVDPKPAGAADLPTRDEL